MEVVITIIILVTAVKSWFVIKTNQRAAYIDSYIFPERIIRKVHEQYPHLNDEQLAQVTKGLREFFHIVVHSRRRMVSMPSQAVDTAWHEFILFTREYQEFCSKALGRFLHHTPAESMSSPTVAQAGIRVAWRLACAGEGIAPTQPSRLPLLFAIDALVEIPEGFHYALDCQALTNHTGRVIYCATHIHQSGGGGRCDGGGGGCGGGGGYGCGGGCGGCGGCGG